MSSPTFNIQRLAILSRLTLTDEECTRYEAQIGRILDYMSLLERHDLSQVEPTAHAMPVFDVWRQDETADSFLPEAALSNAPSKSGGQFRMPRVIEE